MHTVDGKSFSENQAGSLYDVVEELTQRLQRHEAVDLQQVVAEHPEHAEPLKQILPALEIFAELGSTAGSDSLAVSPLAGRTSPHDETPGTLGDFRILREIGRGGMGVVYEASQISLDRRVALKVLPLAGMLDPRRLQRFKNEARAAAGLHHPGIVPVHAVGCERGVHYYAMQYIEGVTLAQVIANERDRLSPWAGSQGRIQDSGFGIQGTQNLPPLGRGGRGGARGPLIEQSGGDEDRGSKIEDRDTAESLRSSILHPRSSTVVNAFSTESFGHRPAHATDRYRTIAEWGIQIAEALEYAHSVGVIHRDIKPANLILDETGNIWITDFGLAQLETDAGLTMTGDVVGTLRYMSPEQALGERGLVDQRSDVYSLGLTLYELLARTAAFATADRRELLHRIANDDPLAVRRIVPSIPVELETIVHKAIEKEAAARYTTARELADDLRRFLREQPIRARRASALDRARKWSRRNRRLVQAAVLSVTVLLVCGVVAAFLLERAHHETRLAQKSAESDRKLAATAQATHRLHEYVTAINLADRAWRSGQLDDARKHLLPWRENKEEDDLRGFEWHYLWRIVHESLASFGSHQGSAYCSTLSPDGRMLATGGTDGVRIWDAATGAPIKHLNEHAADVNGVAFSRDGRRFATASDDRTAKVWNVSDWSVLETIPQAGYVVQVEFSKDGRFLLFGLRSEFRPNGHATFRAATQIWDLNLKKPHKIVHGHEACLESLTLSPDGETFATTGDDVLCVWKHPNGDLVRRIPNNHDPEDHAGADCVVFAHTQPWLASVSGPYLRIWNAVSGDKVAELPSSSPRLRGVTFSRDDSLIAAGGEDSQVHVWVRESDGQYDYQPPLHAHSRLWSLTFLGDDRLVTTAESGSVQVWDVQKVSHERRIRTPAVTRANFAFSPDGRTLFAATGDLERCEMTGPWARVTIAGNGTPVAAVAVSADGRMLAAGGENGVVSALNSDLSCRWSWSPDFNSGPVAHLRFLAGSERIATRHPGRDTATYFDAPSGRIVPPAVPLENPQCRVCFAPNGSTAVLLRAGGQLEVWEGGQELWSIEAPGAVWREAAFSHDGRRLAVGRDDGMIHVWQVSVPDSEIVFQGASHPIGLIAFSANAQTLAGTVEGGRVRLWNIASGRELLALNLGLGEIRKLEFAPGDTALCAGGAGLDGTGEIVVWRASVTTGDADVIPPGRRER